MIDTTGWLEFPFTVNGIQFISKANPESELGLTMASVPREVLDNLNIQTVLQIIPNVSELSREELDKVIEVVNANGTSAVIVPA